MTRILFFFLKKRKSVLVFHKHLIYLFEGHTKTTQRPSGLSIIHTSHCLAPPPPKKIRLSTPWGPVCQNDYLVDRVAHGELAKGCHGIDLAVEVGFKEVGVDLVYMEVGHPHPNLSKCPVPLVISGQENRTLRAWSLAELEGRDKKA